MRLQVEGPLIVQADSCRAVRVDLNGPIGMSETRGSYSTAYQVIGTGHLKTSISATCREASMIDGLLPSLSSLAGRHRKIFPRRYLNRDYRAHVLIGVDISASLNSSDTSS